jgi:lambda family phage tail tape measure protein
MADTTLSVAVDTSEAIKNLNSLKTAFAGLVSTIAIKQLMDFSDSITNITNRIRNLNPDIDVASKQFNAIASIAMSTRAPLSDVASLFSKLQVTTKDLGLSQQDVATLTETLTNELVKSGSSATETSSAMYQFSQAMALGVFQGNDLHSLIQSMPTTMQKFADSIGVPMGALRDLGSSGSITAEMMVKFLKSISETSNAGNSIITFSQAFNTLKTASAVAFNEFEKNTQVGQNLAASIEYIAFQIYKLSKNIDVIIGPLKFLGEVAAALLIFTAVGKAFALVGETLTVIWRLFTSAGAVVKNFIEAIAEFPAIMAEAGGGLHAFGEAVIWLLRPLGWLASGLASIGAAVYAWSGLKDLEEAISNFGDANSDTSKELETFRNELKKNKTELDNTTSSNVAAEFQAKKLAYALSLVALASRQQTEDLATNLNRVREKLKFDAEQIIVAGEFTNKSKDQIEIDTALRDLTYEKADAIRRLTEEQQKLQTELKNPTVLADATQAQELRGRIGIIGQQIVKEKELYDQQAKALPEYIVQLQSAKLLEQARIKDTENMVKAIDDQIARQEKLSDILTGANRNRAEVTKQIPPEQLIGLTTIQKKILDIQESKRKAGEEAARTFADSFSNQDMTIEKTKEMQDGIDQITEAYKRLNDVQVESAKHADEVQRQFSTGWRDAYASYADNATNAADQAKTYFDDFTRGFEDAMVRLVQTGKLSFTDLANSMIADFVRIQAKKMLLGIGTMVGGTGGSGGLFGGSIIPGFLAGGGDAQPNSPYIIGERGPELFIPKVSGTVVPNDRLGGAMGQPQQTVVNYNIQAVDASSFRSLVARDPSFIYAVTEKGRQSQPTRRLA